MFMYSQQTIEKGKLHECAVSAVCLVSFFSPRFIVNIFIDCRLCRATGSFWAFL